ncbi:acyl-CoA thioesterase [Azospirillum doebereinerae]|uniref:Acyl-CoA thioesterase n=1 Tax=Azospirillum doebereinerae TaxID=92933 RepID=A0A433JCJ8_9PROT|nr:thioesterase family protein [Azospirillum doebereinerae]MCG5243853.1 acyl-CoA thioesterase [Azospirillum doebereinerae]RUQ74275.1 acyl-CoA thioesterase [Azospirillum doebereinerae]
MTDSPDLTRPDSYRFWHEERVRFADLDALGHVNNNALGVYFEQGRIALLLAAGGFRASDDWTVVMARSVIEYRSELLYPNDVRIGVRGLRMGTSSMTLGVGIFLGERCVATQEAVCVVVDKASHRPTPLPEPLRAALAEA